jgi:multidrug resistance protein MdtO
MAARDRVRRWQASLRTFYLLEAPLLQFRLFSRVDRSRPFAQLEDHFRKACAQALQDMAKIIEQQLANKHAQADQPQNLMRLLDGLESNAEASFTERERALMRMSRKIASLLDRLQAEVNSEPIYAAY